jgi:hypothetical protein
MVLVQREYDNYELFLFAYPSTLISPCHKITGTVTVIISGDKQ